MRHPSPRRHPSRHRIGVALLTAVLAVGALTACANTPFGSSDGNLSAQAQHRVAEMVRHLYRGPTDTIEDYARWAASDLGESGPTQLIGYQAYPGAAHDKPFGALQFRVELERYGRSDPFVACFESKFDYWGVATPQFDQWGHDNAVTRTIRCPAGAHRIDPPVDTRPVYVVPDGADKVVIDILEHAPAGASTADILAEVKSRMPQPTGDREVAFEPDVLIAEGLIGFAMGDADHCLLVKRDLSGKAAVMSVPRVYLRPGELGCRADTALRAGNLRAPH